MTTLRNWDVIDANNNLAPPDGWPENTMQYSEVNNTGRAVQGTLRRFYGDINGSLAAAGVANAYTVALNESGYTSYFVGMFFRCSIPATNTGAVTIDVNGIGPQNVLCNGVPLAGGELQSGCVHTFVYRGSSFQLENSAGGIVATGRFTNPNNPDLLDTDVAINVGAVDPDTTPHLEIGPSSIQAKDDATTATASLEIGTLGTQQVSLGGGIAAQTATAALGGLFVNNLATGLGLERVLTTADLVTSGITVQDEGTPLATAATTLNFTGAGVTASGAGATKTINIPGGGGVTQPITTTYTFESPGKVVFDVPGGGGPTVTFENDGTDLNVTGEAAIGSLKFFGGLPLIVYEPGLAPTATVSMNHNGTNAIIGTNTTGGNLRFLTTDVGSSIDFEPEAVLTGRFREGLGLDIISDQVLATGTHGVFFRNSALTLTGRLGMFAGPNLEFANFINGGDIVMTHNTSLGAVRTAFSSDPDNATGAVLYAVGNQAIQARSVSSGGTSSGRVSDAGGIFYDIGFNLMPKVNANVSGDFTIRNNVGKIIHNSSGGSLTYTLNQQSATDVASVWNVAHEDTGTLTIAEGTGVTLKWFDGSGGAPSTGNRSLAQGGVATIYKASSTEFWIWGSGIS